MGALTRKKSIPALVFAAIHEVPVVEPRAAASLFRHVEPDGVNHMKTAAGGGGGPSNVPGVVRDFRIQQNDIQIRLTHAPAHGSDRGRIDGQRRCCWPFLEQSPLVSLKGSIFSDPDRTTNSI